MNYLGRTVVKAIIAAKKTRKRAGVFAGLDGAARLPHGAQIFQLRRAMENKVTPCE